MQQRHFSYIYAQKPSLTVIKGIRKIRSSSCLNSFSVAAADTLLFDCFQHAMSVLLIAGSPTVPSRSGALLSAVSHAVTARYPDLCQETLQVRDLPPVALLQADWSDERLAHAIQQVKRAQHIVLATPIYKAAYSGVLKAFLDLLPQDALREKTVLPLATGGSSLHMLALDYALRPVLQSMSPRLVLQGVYATDAQLNKRPLGGYDIAPEIVQRLFEAVDTLLPAVQQAPARAALATCPVA